MKMPGSSRIPLICSMGVAVLLACDAWALDPVDCKDVSPEHTVEEGRYPNGKLQAQTCKLNGVSDGPHRIWFPDGSPKVEGQYLDGAMFGKWMRWHANGNQHDEGGWVESKPQGPWRIWHEDGQLQAEGGFREGREHGPWTVWYKGGQKREEGEYEGGRRVCTWKTWDKAGVEKETREGERREGAKCDETPVAVESKPPAKTVFSNSSISTIVGVSSLSYKETGYADYSAVVITPKASFRYLLAPRWDLGISAYGTAAPLTSSQSGVKVRFMGLNGRVGYSTSLLPFPWKLSILMGGYYTTMMVSGAPFGFKGLMGPQVFPSFRYVLPNQDIVSATLKYSPIGTIFSLKDREYAAGLAWTRVLGAGHPFTVFADLANLRCSNEGVTADSTSMTLSVGYSW